MFDDYPELKELKDVSQLLAEFDQWEALYDERQLKNNTVAVYAASFIDDMYVDYDLARETARKVKGIKTFETNSSKYIASSYPWFRSSRCPLAAQTLIREPY